MKTFTVAGRSTLKGVTKIRFANDLVGRVKKLQAHGHTNVELQELPRAMTKDEIRVFLGVAPAAATEQPAATTEQPAATTDQPAATTDQPAEESAVTYASFEEALATIPLREKGRFIKKEVREQMARDLMTA